MTLTWTIRRPAPHPIAIVDFNEVDWEEQSYLAAVRPPYHAKGQPRKQGGGQKAKGNKTFTICWRHKRYGDRAHKCDDTTTCQWSEN